MASSSSASPSPFGANVSEKLNRDNYLLQKTQVMPPIRGAQLESTLDGSSKALSKLLHLVKI
jgi:hypothetical protein